MAIDNECRKQSEPLYCSTSAALRQLLRDERQQSGLSQKELGEAVGVTGLAISRLERGMVKRAPVALLRRIAQELKLADDTLLNLRERRPTPEAETPKVAVRPTKFCRHCGTRVYDDSNFCHRCGTRIIAMAGSCSSCGAPLYADSVFCQHCGKRIRVKAHNRSD